MSVSPDYLTYVVDQLAAFAPVRSRRMFGAVGLYADDMFFALIDNDTLYFKVDDTNRADYQARGCRPFQPFPDDPTYSMSYFEVPAEVIEDGDELKLWARKSCAAALAKLAQKKPRARAKKKSKKKQSKNKPGAKMQSRRSKASRG